eukprot:344020-Rhodomonas_salina.1
MCCWAVFLGCPMLSCGVAVLGHQWTPVLKQSVVIQVVGIAAVKYADLSVAFPAMCYAHGGRRLVLTAARVLPDEPREQLPLLVQEDALPLWYPRPYAAAMRCPVLTLRMLLPGNTAPYMLYAFARINGIRNK